MAGSVVELWSALGGDVEPFENSSKDLLRFVDWDNDGDVDFLLGTYQQSSFHILLHEQISDHFFHVHELVTLTGLRRKRAISKDWFFFHPEDTDDTWLYPGVSEAYRSNSSTVEGFHVADWDGDGKLDLLLCMQGPTVSIITFLNRALLPVDSIESGSLILSTSSMRQDTLCDMQPVDFDEDGVVDLFLGGFTRYFRRESADSDLIEQTNPLGIYNGSVLQVFDFDADGHLELLLDAFPPNDHIQLVAFRWLRRALDGSFVESEENPFVDVRFQNLGHSLNRDNIQEMYLADWNSDGLMDIVIVRFSELHDGTSMLGFNLGFSQALAVADCYQQVRNRDMIYNSHLTVFDEIRVNSLDEISVLDWNQDGFDDHVDIKSHTQLYEISDAGAKPVPKPTPKSLLTNFYSFVDLDGDGDLDLLNESRGWILYWEQVDGQFHHTEDLRTWSLDLHHTTTEILPVDWDQDGDVDLVLGEEVRKQVLGEVVGNQARYFERLPDGSLHEKQQHPFKGTFAFHAIRTSKSALFLDCDGDGDLDVLRVDVGPSVWGKNQPVQACEHDNDAGTLTCGHEFLCLGTNLSNFDYDDFDRFGSLVSLDLVNISDGRLKFAAIHSNKPSPVLWTAGFCTPSSPCNGKGFCTKNNQHCICQKGHELEDCSQCERNFHGVFQDVWQVRGCKSCPKSDGHLCHGRGECFDDAQAPRDSTALLVAGNGSCHCHEAVIRTLKNMFPQGEFS